MKLFPQREKLIVCPLKIEAKTKGGIHLPGNSSDAEYRIGRVVAVGPGRDLEAGDRKTDVPVSVGNLIVYSPMAGRYNFSNSLLEQYELVPPNCTVVEHSDVMFVVTPETDDEVARVEAMLGSFDETTLDPESAENAQIKAEIALEDRLQRT